MAALDVLPLDRAKRHLNIPANRTEDDAELSEDFIPPAVERVERHLGRELVPAEMTGSERLAVKVVLAEYWRTQRVSTGRGGYTGGTSAAAFEGDSDPTGAAPLRRRLADLLGPSAEDSTGGAGSGPVGSFPPAQPWPDPAVVQYGSAWW